MLKSSLALLLLGVLAGGVGGYLAGHSMQRDVTAEMSTIQTELRIISNRLSAFRAVEYQDPSGQLAPMQIQSLDHEYLLREIKKSVLDMVSQTLQEQLRGEFALLRRQMENSDVASQQTMAPYDVEKARVGEAQADAVLGQAISQGVWTQSDKQEFGDALRHLSGNALAEAWRRLSVAINNGDIVLAEGVSPF